VWVDLSKRDLPIGTFIQDHSDCSDSGCGLLSLESERAHLLMVGHTVGRCLAPTFQTARHHPGLAGA
jgi:hypothetical protein